MTAVLRPNTVNVALGSGSQGSLTFNANNPTIPATLQVTTQTFADSSGRGSGLLAFRRSTGSTTTTYTQSATDGLFRDSNGDLWSGETPGRGMTASFGSRVRQQMGTAINDADNISNVQRNTWAGRGLATGVNPVPTNNTSTAGGTDQGLNADQINAIGQQAFSGVVHNRNFGNLRYPITLQSDTDFMKIVMKRYVPGEFRTGLGARANERRMTSQGTVILPIPNALRDSNKTNWGSHSMNDIQAKAAAAGLELMGGKEGEKAKDMEALTELLKDKATETTAKTQLLSQLPGIKATGNQIRARAAGSVLNPNLELLFNGPAMRAFDYSVRMTPRGADEAIMVKKIIRFFKEGSAAKVTTASMYLQTPNVFQVSFHSGGGGEHPWLGKMKVAALASVGVNYVPDGTYMTLPNASMTAYEITLNFQELDPILDTDYADVDLQFGELNHIGY